MKTIILTDAEYEIVRRAVESHVDMTNDLLFENLPDLNPREGEPSVIDHTRATALRNEIGDNMMHMHLTWTVAGKFGLEVLKNGYTKRIDS